MISELLGCPTQKFLEVFWGKSQIFNSGGAINCLTDLPSLADLDSLYYALESAGERLGVVDGHASPSSGTSLVRPDGRVALDEVHAAYLAGKTLLLTHLQNSHLGVAHIARRIESELHRSGVLLRKELGANLFLTPPLARGFEPHYDGHDVLILQLSGEKTWRTYDMLSEIPAGMEGGLVPIDKLGPIRDILVLGRGDVLYLPRGVPHVAHTTSANSLHLTLSIVPATWSDLIVEELKTNGEIDTRLTTTSLSPLVQIKERQVKDLKNDLGKRWLASLHALPEFAPWNTSLDQSTMCVRLAEGIIAELEIAPSGETVEVRLPGSSITIGADGLETVQLLLNGQYLTPSDISLGGRSEDSKSRFLKRLVEVGIAKPTTDFSD